MLSLTKKTDYALVALAVLVDQGADETEPISATRIAQQFGLSQHVLMKVLKDLQRAGLIASTRGAHGGYYLAKSSAWITLADVIAAIEGPAQLTPCCCDDGDDSCVACHVIPNCPIGDRMQQINERVNSFFRQITLRDLVSDNFKVATTDVTVDSKALREKPNLEATCMDSK